MCQKRGLRQGDPLSPLLYVLSFEPLLKKLNSSLRGIRLEKGHLKTKAFADDTVIAVNNQDWSTLKRLLITYQFISNAKINETKSKLLFLSSPSQRILQSALPFTPIEENERITFLGLPIINRTFSSTILWKEITSLMKNKFESLSQRNLSIRGRVLATKSLVYSKAWYYTVVLPPNFKTKKTISSITSQFIRNSSLLPAYQKLSLPLTKGGIAAPDWQLSINSILTKQCITLFTSKSLWATNARSLLEKNLKSRSSRKLDLFQALENINSTLGWPRKWIPWIAAWRKSGGSFQDSFTSPYICKSDLYINNINATVFTVRKGIKILQKPTRQHSLNEKLWFLLWKLPLDNKKKEIVWKFLSNAFASGERLKRFNPISCPFCNLQDFNRTHFLATCPSRTK